MLIKAEKLLLFITQHHKKNTALVSPYTQKINEHAVYIPYLNRHYINCITTCQCVIFYVYRLKSGIKFVLVHSSGRNLRLHKWSGPEFSRSFVQTLVVAQMSTWSHKRPGVLPDLTKDTVRCKLGKNMCNLRQHASSFGEVFIVIISTQSTEWIFAC